MDWHTFLKLTHIVGTVFGVGGSTLAEIYYTKFSKDQKIDPFEHDVLKICYSFMRWGLILLIFSGFGFLVLWRLNSLGPEVFYSSRFLAKLTVVGVLLLVALLLNFRIINFEIGTSVALTSWYMAMVLGIWRNLEASYFIIVFFYLLAMTLVYLFLSFIRRVIK